MDALMANYGSDSDDDNEPAAVVGGAPEPQEASVLLPPPPLDLLQPPNFVGLAFLNLSRSFWGSVACKIYIQKLLRSYDLCVAISYAVVIPFNARKQLTLVMRRAASLVPDLYAVDADYALSDLCKDEQKLEKVLLGREFHVHQIDSLVAMLRQKFQSQQRYWMDFNKWEHFVNDDSTRSFLSLEVTRTGLPEISKQIHMVDEVYRLHGLPEFYKNPRPHISLAWALGDVSSKLKQATKEIEKFENSINSSKNCNLRCNFSRIVCKVGKKVYDICKIGD
ncbi:hypothetical protein TRIUR3_35251 [Triticum urartu]|uniref:U6 snRNA phosphodiesterase 1 n=1 Tax=Triticum urartu TaxID=4572 RepID=M8AFP5_TRIUA|nr:hypothetical protein TRIUR3_35251 [Triticum urartu]